jgi:hypothetical protein
MRLLIIKLALYGFLQPSLNCCHLYQNIYLKTLFLNNFNLCSSLKVKDLRKRAKILHMESYSNRRVNVSWLILNKV